MRPNGAISFSVRLLHLSVCAEIFKWSSFSHALSGCWREMANKRVTLSFNVGASWYGTHTHCTGNVVQFERKTFFLRLITGGQHPGSQKWASRFLRTVYQSRAERQATDASAASGCCGSQGAKIFLSPFQHVRAADAIHFEANIKSIFCPFLPAHCLKLQQLRHDQTPDEGTCERTKVRGQFVSVQTIGFFERTGTVPPGPRLAGCRCWIGWNLIYNARWMRFYREGGRERKVE